MAERERLICAGGDLVDGGAGVRFEIDRNGAKTPAFAIRFRGQVQAYVNRCAHVPTELDWTRGQFFDSSGLYLICATHGALYAPETGACLLGRCDGKGLKKLAVSERDGQVYLMESD